MGNGNDKEGGDYVGYGCYCGYGGVVWVEVGFVKDYCYEVGYLYYVEDEDWIEN